MDTRKATEETADVLLVRWRYPTELPERGRSQSGPDAVDMPISAIAANICEKCGLKHKHNKRIHFAVLPCHFFLMRLISTHSQANWLLASYADILEDQETKRAHAQAAQPYVVGQQMIQVKQGDQGQILVQLALGRCVQLPTLLIVDRFLCLG